MLLINSTSSASLYADDYAIVAGLSPVNAEDVDLDRFPKVADALVLKATVHKGDVLYIPDYWWHHVRSSAAASIGASLWFYPLNLEPQIKAMGKSLVSLVSLYHTYGLLPLSFK